MKKRNLFVLTALTGFFLWGCYPDGPDYYEDMDVVITKYNPEYDFTGPKTYAMPDKIVKITGDLTEGDEPSFIPDVYGNQILNRIATNLDALGWEKHDIADTATTQIDVIVLPASWETTTIYYYYDYWSYWYGGYWGWYYPYYPYYGGGYYDSYSTGTLIWTVIDTDRSLVGANGNPVFQWTAAVNGILTNVYSANRVNKAIDKAFAQSPYLKTN